MAGKHIAIDTKPDSRPVYPGTHTDRAYSEGRGLIQTGGEPANPHVPGTPEFDAFQSGMDNAAIAKEQIQTCWAGGT